MSKPILSVIGLGKLGSPAAIVFAAKGFQVIGVDRNKNYVDAINNGKAPVMEPQLQEYLDRCRQNIRATQDYGQAIKKSDITFLIVPTPSLPNGHFSDEYLKAALKELALELKNSSKPFHTFVIVSTVSPTTIEKNLIPWVEQYSGRKFNQGFGMAYNPEFIALGDVVNGLLRPDLVLIGEGNRKIGDMLEEIYGQVCENEPYIARMSIISAEIAKISLNAYITMKISYANALANICERIPGADLDAITKALGADKRVSPYYLKGAMPFGGPCFPRDSRAFIAFTREQGIEAVLAQATDKVNRFQIPNLLSRIKRLNLADKSASVLGLAFKPRTPVMEESPAIHIVEELLKEGLRVTVYDPLAMGNMKAVFGDKIAYASSVKEALRSSSLCIIATPDKEFTNLSSEDILHDPTTIIDCWRLLDPTKFGKKVRIIRLGYFEEDL